MNDFRYAVRQLAKSPGFTAVAVATLALGTGANSLLFSVIHAVLLRPLPYPESERIVSVNIVPRDEGAARSLAGQAPHHAYLQWRQQSGSFAALAAYRETGASVGRGGGAPDRLSGAQVTANFFALLGVQPAVGRSFTEDELLPGGPPVVVLSYRLWQKSFGGDVGIVGRAVALDGAPVAVVGVLPASFDFPRDASFWTPLRLPAAGPITFFVHVVGRVARGVSIAQAETELSGLFRRGQEQLHPLLRAAAVDVVTLREGLYGSTRPLLLILLGAAGFVLLVACANVASLLVARAVARERDLAIRAALGASWLRLTRQTLAESLVLAGVGAVAGLLVPVFGLRVFMDAVPLGAQGIEVHLDAPVLAFTMGLALLTAMVFGVGPALVASRPSRLESLKSGGGQPSAADHRARLRETLVVAELTVVLVLLAGAGLLSRSLLNLLAVDPGFRPDHVVVAKLILSPSRYVQVRGRSVFYAALLERLGALPGVESVALADALPLGGFGSKLSVRLDDAPPVTDGSRDAALNAVSADYFKTLGVAVIAGRSFTSADRLDAAPVAIVNTAFARAFLGGGDPVGHQLQVPGMTPALWTIVGEVKDIRQLGREVPAAPEVFLPAPQAGHTPGAVAIRTVGDPEALVETVRRAVEEIDPEQPASRVFTLESELARSAAPQRVNALLLGMFAGVALMLAAVGLAGVSATLVAQRTREIGVRMALGAEQGDVVRLILGQAARLVAIAVVLGLVAALALTRVLTSLLFGVSPADPTTFLLVPLVLAAVALLAAFIPARRAMRIDPAVALRHE
ncbi:MAG: ABC transporter permease [Thermoleophilaceae bacterium]